MGQLKLKLPEKPKFQTRQQMLDHIDKITMFIIRDEKDELSKYWLALNVMVQIELGTWLLFAVDVLDANPE